MSHARLLLWLLALATLAPAAAQPRPHGAAEETECEPKRQSCVAGCRAQYFTIDPKRAGCTATCEAVAARCGGHRPGR